MTSAQQPQRILFISRNLPPILGGMELLNWHMADELSKYADVSLVGPCGSAALRPSKVPIAEAPLRPLWKFLLVSTWLAITHSITKRPAVVLAGSGLTAPIAWLAARLCGAKAVAYVHGLDITVPNRTYQRLWVPLLRRMDSVIANSHPTADLARTAGIDPARVNIVYPGVKLPEATPAANCTKQFREKFSLGDGPLLLSVGRLTSRKGLSEFVSSILPPIVAKYPQAKLVIIGAPPEQALHAEVLTPEKLQAEAELAGVGKNIQFLGAVSAEDLSAAYFSAALHVFPVQHIPGNPEGFGMVAIEAAAHGLATVAYATGGVVDAVEDGVSGALVEAGNAEAFIAATLRLLASPLPASPIRTFSEQFTWQVFGAKVFSALAAETKTLSPASGRE